MKKLMLILLIATSIILMSCAQKTEKKGEKLEFKTLTAEGIAKIKEKVKNTPAIPVKEDEIAIIETKFGKMTVEFFTDIAPNHCANFKRLTNSGYYSGTTFHRVIPGFVIQGGDINSRDNNKANDGMGGPGYTVDAEFNKTPHVKGILSMARSQNVNSAGSQFFICAGDVGQLDNNYTVFGKVTEGLDVIDSIVNVPRNERDNPNDPVYMKVTMKTK
ncbi:MAG: peptidylprolyl isomerase [Candidatus Marinimicrobia bacterium]|nr:peptidylprolyl isomerase [Candidatus Neomarinimicrobiota bacterium]